jgi:hypothetical protein
MEGMCADEDGPRNTKTEKCGTCWNGEKDVDVCRAWNLLVSWAGNFQGFIELETLSDRSDSWHDTDLLFFLPETTLP